MGLLKRLDGSIAEIPDHEMGEALASGKFKPVSDEQDIAISEDGEVSTVKGKDYEGYKKLYGAEDESAASFNRREDRARMENERGGIGGKLRTLAEGAANSATLGAYNAVGGLVGGDEFRTRRKEDKLVNSEYDTAGEVLGYLAPTGLAKVGGALGKAAKYSPVGLAERAGERIIASGAGRGALSQITRSGAGLAVEGGLVGAGETLGEYGLATSDLEREQAIGNLSSNVFFGAATGGAIGAGAKGAGLALKKGRKIAEDVGAKMEAKRAAADLSEDVASLDLEGIRGARASEQALVSKQIFEGVTDYRKLSQEIDPMLLGVEKGQLRAGKKKLAAELKSPKDFMDAPGRAAERALRKEENALRAIIDQKDSLLAKLAEKDTKLLKEIDSLDAGMLKGKALTDRFNDFSGSRFTAKEAREGVEVAAEDMAKFRKALENGSAAGLRKQSLDRIPELLEANLRQQDAITALKTGATPRLTELRIAEDALKSTPKETKSMLQKIGEGATMSGATAGLAAVGVPWTAAAVMGASVSEKLSSMIFGKLGKAAKGTAAKTSGAVDKLLDVGGKIGKVAPPLATKVLAGVRFGDEDKTNRDFHKSELAKSFKAREAELYAQVTRGPNGITMRPAARRKIAQELAGVKLASPQLADSMETMINRRIAFLAQKLPKKPDYLAESVGPDTWVPNDQDIRGWARYVAAAEDPTGVEDRLADGTITPEDVEAYREVYPERYQDIRRQIATRLPELQATLPIEKRMALSMFTDLDVEPALNPIIFGRLQAQYGEEPGTERGTMAPMPQADFSAFGSSRSADKLKTPSQNRT